MKKFLRRASIAMFALAIGYGIFSLTVQPSLDRDWTDDQKVLSHTTFNKDGTVTIENIRNIDYRSTTEYDPSYYSATYDPSKIKRAWFMVEPFGSLNAAHTLVSFEFEDGRFLSVSAEIRKEKGESFSPLKGLLRRYELVYVVADERDVIRLRTNYRKDDVRLYPIDGEKESVKNVFLGMLARANKLATEPEMYNTLTNNCTTNLAHHVRAFSEAEIPWWDVRYLFPENADKVAYDAGLIDTDLPFEEARDYFYITDRAQKLDKDPEFSKKIREFGEEN
jgi:hypothetical protein